MFGINTNFYWRFVWGLVFMLGVFLNAVALIYMGSLLKNDSVEVINLQFWGCVTLALFWINFIPLIGNSKGDFSSTWQCFLTCQSPWYFCLNINSCQHYWISVRKSFGFSDCGRHTFINHILDSVSTFEPNNTTRYYF